MPGRFAHNNRGSPLLKDFGCRNNHGRVGRHVGNLARRLDQIRFEQNQLTLQAIRFDARRHEPLANRLWQGSVIPLVAGNKDRGSLSRNMPIRRTASHRGCCEAAGNDQFAARYGLWLQPKIAFRFQVILRL